MDFSESVMIALLPTTSEWCHIELPHLTLVYAGEIPDHIPTVHNKMVKTTLDLALAYSPLILETEGVETFGDEDYRVDVYTLIPTAELMAMRSIVEKWNVSEYPFRPHVTIGPEGTANQTMPKTIVFDKLLVSWGNNHIQFKLTGT